MSDMLEFLNFPEASWELAHLCTGCGLIKADVEFCISAYMDEFYPEEVQVPRPTCDECAEQDRNDI